jgi:hypothetical protein
MPICLAGWRLLLLMLGGAVRVVTMFSLHFILLQWGENFPARKSMLRLQLGVFNYRN